MSLKRGRFSVASVLSVQVWLRHDACGRNGLQFRPQPAFFEVNRRFQPAEFKGRLACLDVEQASLVVRVDSDALEHEKWPWA